MASASVFMLLFSCVFPSGNGDHGKERDICISKGTLRKQFYWLSINHGWFGERANCSENGALHLPLGNRVERVRKKNLAQGNATNGTSNFLLFLPHSLPLLFPQSHIPTAVFYRLVVSSHHERRFFRSVTWTSTRQSLRETSCHFLLLAT